MDRLAIMHSIIAKTLFLLSYHPKII